MTAEKKIRRPRNYKMSKGLKIYLALGNFADDTHRGLFKQALMDAEISSVFSVKKDVEAVSAEVEDLAPVV